MKNHLVIGASSGIGKAIAELLLLEGDSVYGTYHSHPDSSSGVIMHAMDVTSDTIDTGYLPQTLDSLVFCPGAITLKPFNRMPASDFIGDINLQVGGFVRVLQAVLPRLKASGRASVVVFSSIAANVGLPFHSQVSTTKGALESLTRALAAEFAPTIRVNCIAPSLTDTPLAGSLLNTPEKKEANAQRHPMKRIGSAIDMAHMAAFLISEKSGWITGQVMRVDGGMSSIR